jgi:hypothetical protein
MESSPIAVPILCLAFAVVAPDGPLAAAVIRTEQSGSSSIEVGGVEVERSGDAAVDGRVSVFAIEGTFTTPESRTAARASASEIAVNAKLDDKHLFSGTPWTLTLSQAVYTIRADSSALVSRAELDFHLPPAYLEVTSNAEFAQSTLEVTLQAQLAVCFQSSCGASDARFFLQDILEASYQSYQHGPNVRGDPSLDLAPLRNPTVTDTGFGQGFYRTVNVSFPEFSGHLDLGLVPAGDPITVEYLLQVRASGIGRDNVAIAAINDPFTLATDPVRLGAPLVLSLTEIPEPGTAALVAVGGGLLAALRRRA